MDKASRATLVAREARGMVVRDDPVAGDERFDPTADFDDLAGDLVPENRSRLAAHVPVEQVRSADAGGGHPQDRVTRGRDGTGDVHDLDAPVGESRTAFMPRNGATATRRIGRRRRRACASRNLGRSASVRRPETRGEGSTLPDAISASASFASAGVEWNAPISEISA